MVTPAGDILLISSNFVDFFLDRLRLHTRLGHSAAAEIVFAFTPNSAAAERVFSLLKAMFGDQQLGALADIIQTALMLRYNKRNVG